MPSWFSTDLPTAAATVASAVLIYAVLITLVRVVGLRSFAKMSSVDFAMTIAMGSVLASTILTPSPPLVQGAIAIATLFGIQWSVSKLRKSTGWMNDVVDNEPLVLMAGRRILHENLRQARVTEDDLWAKLREANVIDPGQVRAVIFETTGDISVLHGPADGTPLHPSLLRGVRPADGFALGEDDYEGA